MRSRTFVLDLYIRMWYIYYIATATCGFFVWRVLTMEEESKEYLKELIKEIIDGIDNEDILVYLHTFISLKVKAEE